MGTEREYFPCYFSYRKKIAKLSDQEVGRLFRSLLEYAETGETEELTGRESVAFDFIADDIDRAKKNYADKCANNKSNVEKRYERIRSYTTVYDSREDKDKDKDKDESEYKDEDKDESEKNILSRADRPTCRADARRAVESWNSLGFSQVSKMSADSTRYKMLCARINEHGIETVLSAIENVRESDFLRGQNKNGWIITLDWFVKPNNFVKVLDGNYGNREKAEGGGKSGVDWIMNMEL